MQYLSGDFAICAQITADDLRGAKDQGFATVFCLRPDREDADQPAFEVLNELAKSLGLNMHHHPVVPGAITQEDFATFRDLYEAAPKPILAYCKSGGRAKMLWEEL